MITGDDIDRLRGIETPRNDAQNPKDRPDRVLTIGALMMAPLRAFLQAGRP